MIVSPGMIGAILSVAALAYCAGLVGLPASAAEKPSDAAESQPKQCDAYGPGYEPVGGTGACIKITGSVEVDVTASSPSGNPSGANSPDWVRTKPARSGN